MPPLEGIPRSAALLIILDGWGVNPSKLNNGIELAKTPRLDEYFSTNPHTVIQASGMACGLPDGQMGNSEVGHMTMGCGEIVRQDLVKINEAIADGSFKKNENLLDAINQAADKKKPLHLIGLVSDGGVHSHVNHLLALIKLCHSNAVIPILHMITDGRDTPPRSAEKFLSPVESALSAVGGHIATVSGRYYAMDRDNRWERIVFAWNVMVLGEGKQADSASESIQTAYERGEDDEFILPTLIKDGKTIQNDDPVIFFNFRKDRPRQLTVSLFKEDFDEFDRKAFCSAKVTTFTEYDQWFQLPYAFERDKPKTTLAEIISNAGLKQFHCAETEKYAHVTFFFNGGIGDAFPGEERCLLPSPKVPTYDLKPEMSAHEVTDKVIEALAAEEYAYIVVNYANGDMVGHTAVREAIIEAIETVDYEVGRLMDAAREKGYSILLTSDHGNCDEIVDPLTDEPHTRHTTYPVPCLIVDDVPWILSTKGELKNITPTLLHLMGLPKPSKMKAKSLLLGPVKR